MFLWRQKEEWNQEVELLGPLLFSSKTNFNFICWSWISSSWPMAVAYLLKEEKPITKLIYSFFSRGCRFNQNIYKTVVSLLKEVLSQLWNRSREHESNSIWSVTYLQVICLCGRAWFENLLPVLSGVCTRLTTRWC